MPVGERAPDWAEDRERDPGAGDQRAGPEDDRALGAHPDFLQVEREKREDETESEHRGRLRDTDDIQGGLPAPAEQSGDVTRWRRPKAHASRVRSGLARPRDTRRLSRNWEVGRC